ADPGNMYYDEIRIANSWEDLLQNPTYNWDDSASPDHDWSNAENWSGNVEPVLSENAYINGGYTAVVTAVGERCTSLFLGQAERGSVLQTGGELILGSSLGMGISQGTGRGFYTITGGSLTVSNNGLIGDKGIAEILVDGPGASISFGGSMTLGDGGVGIEDTGNLIIVNEGSFTVGGQTYIGNYTQTDGTLYMSGGVFNANSVFNLGEFNGATGRVYVTDGSLVGGGSLADFYIGDEGFGYMHISGGTVDVNGAGGDLIVADDANLGVYCELVLSGGLLDVENDVVVANNAGAAGRMSVQGGHVEVGDNLYAGSAANATGAVLISGGTLKADYAYIANAGYGSCDIGGGAVTVATMRVATWAGSTGALVVTNGSLDVIDSTDLVIAESGNALMNIGDTAVVNVGDGSGETDFFVASAAGSRGVVNQSNGTVSIIAGAANSHLRIGVAATAHGEYNLSGGMLDIDENIYMADQAGSTGILTVAGGALNAGLLYAGYNGYAQYVISGGASTLEEARVGLNAGAEGLLAISAGSLDVTEAGDIIIGDSGVGVMNIDGTAVVNIGDASGETELRIGAAGRGTVNQTNGTVTVVEHVRIGISAGSGGIYNQSGGTLTIEDHVYMGDAATATGRVYASGGTMTANTLFLAYNGKADMKIDGGAVTLAAAQIGVISGAEATMELVDGSLDITGAADLRVGVNGTGILNIDDTGELNIGDNSGETDFMLGVGATGVGIVNQTNGTVTIDSGAGDSILKVGIASGGYAEYNISGGILDIEDHVYVGDGAGGVGTFHVIGDGATIAVDNDFQIYNASSTLKVSFVSSQISAIEVGDDIIINGALTIDDDGSLAAGTYIIATSVNSSAVSGDFVVTNWNGSVEGTVSYADNCIKVTILADQEIAVLGINLAVIPDGDSTPSGADGTDFGSAAIGVGYVDRTFSVTNSGDKDLTLSGVTTSGTHMAEFVVQEWPPVVSPRSVSNLVIRFEPTALGVRTATIHVGSDDADEADYDFAVQGTGIDASAPYVTNWVVDVDNEVTDAQMTSGVFSIMMNICDAEGINTTDSASPHFIPYFSIWNPAGVQILTDEVFSAFTHAASGQEVEAVDTEHAGVSYTANILGTFTNWFSAENSNDVTTVDLDKDDDGNPLLFTVVDDDDAAPTPGHFSPNLLTNAGFETGDYTGWDQWGVGHAVSSDAAESGGYGLWMTNFNGGPGGASAAVIQYMTLANSTTYRMICRARKVGAMDPVAVEIKARRQNADWSDGLEIATNNFVAELTTDWQTFSMTFTTHASDTNYGCFVHVWNNETGSYEGRAEFDTLYVGRATDMAPMQLWRNTSIQRICTNALIAGTTNAIYTYTDYEFRFMNSFPMLLRFAVFDEGSGLSRGTTDPSTQMTVTVYNPETDTYWLSNNCSYYYPSFSSAFADTFQDGGTSTWRIGVLQANEIVGAMVGTTNRITVTVPDTDNDRAGDRSTLTDYQMGYLVIEDDDPDAPLIISNAFGRPLGVG
ncbi:MAG: choice-of-anchor D domain-containing protein, partial [Spartobacteria bacterium]|nr:choice-of-anchor D domain-containing protein [Spartobacteria bacterium]